VTSQQPMQVDAAEVTEEERMIGENLPPGTLRTEPPLQNADFNYYTGIDDSGLVGGGHWTGTRVRRADVVIDGLFSAELAVPRLARSP